MVPYINPEGIRDDNFKRCSTCGDVVPIHELKYESELEDFVDVESANKPAQFVAVGPRRRTFQRDPDNEPQEIPFLAGKPDTDLENMLWDRPGIVTYIEDSDFECERSEQ